VEICFILIKLKKGNIWGGFLRKKWKVFMLFSLIVAMLAGCLGNSTPEEKIHQILEETVNQEKGFEQQQQPITKLENEEKEIYNQIIELGMKEFEQIVTLSNQAIDNIEKREELLEIERESMLASQKEFEKVEQPISDIEDSESKQRAESLQKTMLERYQAHDELYNTYKASISLDKELYNLFKKEELKMDQLQIQIDRINEAYQNVISANERFNQKTEQYNNEKATFYNSAEIELE
jgi:hypothetical protein